MCAPDQHGCYIITLATLNHALSEGANSILGMFPPLLQCFGPDLIPPLTSLRSVKDDTRRTGNADEGLETKREL